MNEFESMDSMLTGALSLLKSEGETRTVGWQRCPCIEAPHPVVLSLTNPSLRFTTLPSRRQSVALAVAEAIWVLSGSNVLDDLPAHFVSTDALTKYSDDGETWRAGYGPRLRYYNSSRKQYRLSRQDIAGISPTDNGKLFVDQLQYCVEVLLDDLYTRHAVIEIADPQKDYYAERGERLVTKDTPCTRYIQFLVSPRTGKLNVYWNMRSNDVIWGLSNANAVCATTLLNVVASLVGCEMGTYYHVATNFHYYADMEEMVKKILSEPEVKEPVGRGFTYSTGRITMHDLRNCLDLFYSYESSLHSGSLDVTNPFRNDPRLDMWEDYATALYVWYVGKALKSIKASDGAKLIDYKPYLRREEEAIKLFHSPQLAYIFSSRKSSDKT